MQTPPPPPPPLSFDPIFMKDAECAESNEKSIFRFLFFELWLIVFTIYQKITYQKELFFKRFKFTGKMRIALKIIFLVLEIFV